MRVQKRGKIVDIPVKRGTVVKLRDSNGRATGAKGIVVGKAPSTNYSRAYGAEVFVCTVSKRSKTAHVSRKNESQFIAAGRARKVPAVCRQALADYEAMYPTLGRKKRSRR